MYQMPQFNLYLDNGSFTGYTGCNGISGRVEVTGTGLRFLNTTPATSIDCLGGFDENILLDMLRRVDAYAYVGDELQLLQGNQVLLRFRKGDQDTSLK
jgi:heat shock protein HslJ